MDATKYRLIVDSLYGRAPLGDFLSDLISQPELQRLRDVRLSNINSMLIPGGANISRFEHSVGVAILAQRTARYLNLSEGDEQRLVCAALLHDVAITPFGHLMEEGFQSANVPFDHETRLQNILFQNIEVGNIDRQIFRGRTVGFRSVLEKVEARRNRVTAEDVFALMQGRGPLGKLIKGSIDLDNIDNVCRMAHHIGIPFRRELPIGVAAGFRIADDRLGFDALRFHLIEEWLDLRTRLYNVLMTNPIDFSAKAMLIEAIRLAIVGAKGMPSILDESSWSYTDGDLLSALNQFPPSIPLLRRLELGDYFELLAFYWLKGGARLPLLQSRVSAMEIRSQLSTLLGLSIDEVLVYWIKDKRDRRVEMPLFDGSTAKSTESAVIGHNSDLVLFGILVGRKAWANRRHEDKCASYLESRCSGRIERCDPRKHLAEAFLPREAGAAAQMELF